MIMYLFSKMLSLTIFTKKILFSFSMVAVSNVLLMNKRYENHFSVTFKFINMRNRDT